jgi:hypothetical protein
MEEQEDDMDIAAAMGFCSFGGTKKRKYDQTDSPKAKIGASGANTTQLGMRTKKAANDDSVNTGNVTGSTPTTNASLQQEMNTQKLPAATGLADFLARAHTLPEKPQHEQEPQSNYTGSSQTDPVEVLSFGGLSISKAELNALRFGVENQHGDMAIFLPNFVEDPWKRFTK